MPKYEYPINVTTPAVLSRWPKYGMSLKIRRQDCLRINALDAQKKVGKSIFGGGFLLSDRAAAEKVAAEKVAAIVWELSEREKRIIKELNENNNGKEIQTIGK